jgi:two-component system, chemotaxis family, protein-glutamate methylesterase/glutaminase
MAEPTRTAVFLLPGEMHYAREATQISTLLGSCVAVVLTDPLHRFGGMNHFLLPDTMGSLPPGKCGDQAVAMLLKMAAMAGSKPVDLRAAVVGGGQVVGHLGSIAGAGLGDVGERNIAAARKALLAAGVRITRNDTGGMNGRRVRLRTDTGELVVESIAQDAATVEAQAKATALKTRKIRILVIDDSATVRNLLKQTLADHPDLEVVGEAEDPFAARQQIMELDPDVLCLDIIMPKLDGLSFLKRLMAYKPIPTVVISTIAKAGSEMHQKLTEAGAVAIFDKEDLALYKGLEICRAKLIPVLMRAATTAVRKIGS